jgi:acetylglutamate/LysW-gamma-L-alpha-aminoadipate kinase
MTLVLKIGGGEGISLTPILTELASLIRADPALRVVLVHGGSHETNVLSEKLGHPARTITSPSGHTSRRTDRETLDIFTMVYCGRVNKSIVEHLQHEGINAVGLSGIDSAIWRGTRKSAIRAIEDGRTVIIRDDLSGTVDAVDADFLNLLLDTGRVPVLTPPRSRRTGSLSTSMPTAPPPAPPQHSARTSCCCSATCGVCCASRGTLRRSSHGSRPRRLKRSAPPPRGA